MVNYQKISTFPIDSPLPWEPLVDSLRSELQEYGALLNLLTQHQQSIIDRDSPKILELNEAIEAQILASTQMRQIRESILTNFAESIALPTNSSVKHIIQIFPDHAQNLIITLFNEILDMVQKTQLIARQNQMLIKRAMEFTEKLLAKLHKKPATKTYNRKGKVSPSVRAEINCLNATA